MTTVPYQGCFEKVVVRRGIYKYRLTERGFLSSCAELDRWLKGCY